MLNQRLHDFDRQWWRGFSLRRYALQRYFAKHEFTAPYLLCCSDCEPLSLSDVLQQTDDACRSRYSPQLVALLKFGLRVTAPV